MLFKYVNNVTIRDYIVRRRMSKAAKEIVRSPGKSILDIGLESGYGSSGECILWEGKEIPSRSKKNGVKKFCRVYNVLA